MNVIDEGMASIISKHDPDAHRQWVRENKSRALVDKTMSAKNAVERFVPDGSNIFFGFFGTRVPMVLIYEIIRQRRRNLDVVRGGLYDLDILIGSGSVSRLDRGYGGGLEVVGLSSVYKRAVANHQLEVIEWSNTAMDWRLKAGAMGIPFIPIRTMVGTDTFRRSAAKVVECPFTGMKVGVVPACNPDVAMVHVTRCDAYGNAQIDGVTALDLEAARASRRVILTTEEVVDNAVIRQEPWRTVIPYYLVDGVVEAPWGAHPSNMPGRYYIDEEFMREWVRFSKTPEGTDAFLRKYVHDVPDFKSYLAAIGGQPRLKRLQEIERLEGE